MLVHPTEVYTVSPWYVNAQAASSMPMAYSLTHTFYLPVHVSSQNLPLSPHTKLPNGHFCCWPIDTSNLINTSEIRLPPFFQSLFVSLLIFHILVNYIQLSGHLNQESWSFPWVLLSSYIILSWELGFFHKVSALTQVFIVCQPA